MNGHLVIIGGEGIGKGGEQPGDDHEERLKALETRVFGESAHDETTEEMGTRLRAKASRRSSQGQMPVIDSKGGMTGPNQEPDR